MRSERKGPEPREFHKALGLAATKRLHSLSREVIPLTRRGEGVTGAAPRDQAPECQKRRRGRVRVGCLMAPGGRPVLHSLVASTWASHRHILSLRRPIGKVGSQLPPPGAVLRATDTPGGGGPCWHSVRLSGQRRPLMSVFIPGDQTAHEGTSLPSHMHIPLRILPPTCPSVTLNAGQGYAFSNGGSAEKHKPSNCSGVGLAGLSKPCPCPQPHSPAHGCHHGVFSARAPESCDRGPVVLRPRLPRCPPLGSSPFTPLCLGEGRGPAGG